MRGSVVGRGLLAAVLGATLLLAAGCFGGNRNFVPGGSSGAQPQASQTSTTRPDVGPRVGNLAPDLSLTGLDGQVVQLSELRGKPVVLNFWATWCPPCKQEMPDIEKAYQKYRGEGLVVLGVDQMEDLDTVQKFVKQNGYSWTFLLDSDGEASKVYRASALPTTYFVDRQGIIRDVQVGAINAALLDSKLTKIR